MASLIQCFKRNKYKAILAAVFLLAAFLRLYGINWDGNSFLHPDERWILMVVDKLDWPSSWRQFINVNSPLNPHFFAYGSFPLYFLKTSQSLVGLFGRQELSLWHLKILGRSLSAFFDLGTLFIVYKFEKRIWGKSAGLLAAFFYATAVFSIQNSHFYTVDIQLTFWCVLAVFLMMRLLNSFSWKVALVLGLAVGFAGATKVTALFLVFPLGVTWLMLLVRRSRGGGGDWKTRWLWPAVVLGIALLTFLLLQPYVLIDFAKFKGDILLQSKMSRNTLAFPYTVQYVGTVPYWYFLKNLVLWGLGIPLGILSLAGLALASLKFCRQVLILIRKGGDFPERGSEGSLEPRSFPHRLSSPALLMVSWAVLYFLITGSFAVKFMRYILPLYPFLAMTAAYGLIRISAVLGRLLTNYELPVSSCQLLVTIFMVLHLGYTVAFLRIYSTPHTRIAASHWINQNIPAGSVLAVEHWDDTLPLFGQQDYQFVTLRLYDTDKGVVVQEVEKNLAQADYMIISSNRLYGSIPRLPDKYAWATQYYRDLFAGNLNFEKVAEFNSYPQVRLGRLKIEFNDDTADESFTVYDHPKVMIFKRGGKGNALASPSGVTTRLPCRNL